MGKNRTVEQQQAIIRGVAEGKHKSSLCREVGVSRSTLHRDLKVPEIRAEIERVRARVLMEAGEEAADNIIHAVKSYKAPRLVKMENEDGKEMMVENPDVDTQLRDHGFKASQLVLQAAGALPTNAPSIFVQNVYNDNRQQTPPEILEILRGLSRREEVGSLVVDAEEED